MNQLSKCILSLALILCTMFTLTSTAFADEANGSYNPSFNQLTSLYDPLNATGSLINDTIPQAQNDNNKTDKDTVNRLVQIWNGIFSVSNQWTSRNTETPLSLRIESNIYIQERVPTVPLIDQRDYPKNRYGKYGTISSHGCGIVALTMVASYWLDQELDVVQMAKDWGKYNTPVGSSWSLFEDSAKKLNIGLQERTYDTKKVMAALENGQVVIALQGQGLFTSTGHFIVLTGLTEDGKITVKDPNGRNYTRSAALRNGFAEGFTPKQIWADGGPYWIYDVKKLQVDSLNDERVTVTYTLKVND